MALKHSLPALNTPPWSAWAVSVEFVIERQGVHLASTRERIPCFIGPFLCFTPTKFRSDFRSVAFGAIWCAGGRGSAVGGGGVYDSWIRSHGGFAPIPPS